MAVLDPAQASSVDALAMRAVDDLDESSGVDVVVGHDARRLSELVEAMSMMSGNAPPPPVATAAPPPRHSPPSTSPPAIRKGAKSPMPKGSRPPSVPEGKGVQSVDVQSGGQRGARLAGATPIHGPRPDSGGATPTPCSTPTNFRSRSQSFQGADFPLLSPAEAAAGGASSCHATEPSMASGQLLRPPTRPKALPPQPKPGTPPSDAQAGQLRAPLIRSRRLWLSGLLAERRPRRQQPAHLPPPA